MAMALKKNEEPNSEAQETDELDPKTVREKAGLTADEMASLMAMSGFGYTAWENGTRRPGGPAYQLLRLLDENPQTVAKALLP
ncbi:transcriptional regulator [Rhodobacteraceae bacterium D3-12]|nr:transcriptional regulator [Rhodobacteraceae bacterium D3-12]